MTKVMIGTLTNVVSIIVCDFNGIVRCNDMPTIMPMQFFGCFILIYKYITIEWIFRFLHRYIYLSTERIRR